MSDEHADLLVSCKQTCVVSCKQAVLFRCDALSSVLDLDSVVLDGKMGSSGGWGTSNSTVVGSWNYQPNSFLEGFVGDSLPAWEAPFVPSSDDPPVPCEYCKCMTSCGRFGCQNRVVPKDVANNRVFRYCYNCSEGVCECTPESSDGNCKICTKLCGCNHCI